MMRINSLFFYAHAYFILLFQIYLFIYLLPVIIIFINDDTFSINFSIVILLDFKFRDCEIKAKLFTYKFPTKKKKIILKNTFNNLLVSAVRVI